MISRQISVAALALVCLAGWLGFHAGATSRPAQSGAHESASAGSRPKPESIPSRDDEPAEDGRAIEAGRGLWRVARSAPVVANSRRSIARAVHDSRRSSRSPTLRRSPLAVLSAHPRSSARTAIGVTVAQRLSGGRRSPLTWSRYGPRTRLARDQCPRGVRLMRKALARMHRCRGPRARDSPGSVPHRSQYAPPTACGPDGASQLLVAAIPTVSGLGEPQVRLAKIIWSRAHRQAARARRPPRPGGHHRHRRRLPGEHARREPRPSPSRTATATPARSSSAPSPAGTAPSPRSPTRRTPPTRSCSATPSPPPSTPRLAPPGTRPAGPAGYHIPGLADVAGWAGPRHHRRGPPGPAIRLPRRGRRRHPPRTRLVACFAGSRAGRSRGATVASRSPSRVADCETDAAPTTCPPTGSPGERAPQAGHAAGAPMRQADLPQDQDVLRLPGPRPLSADHPSGRAVDIMISSAFPNYRSADAVAYGNQIAAWIKAHQRELGVRVHHLAPAHLERRARTATAGGPWPTAATRPPTTSTTSTSPPSATRPGRLPLRRPRWARDRAVTPVEHYTLSARFGQVGSWARYHTGLDFAAPIGTPRPRRPGWRCHPCGLQPSRQLGRRLRHHPPRRRHQHPVRPPGPPRRPSRPDRGDRTTDRHHRHDRPQLRPAPALRDLPAAGPRPAHLHGGEPRQLAPTAGVRALTKAFA